MPKKPFGRSWALSMLCVNSLSDPTTGRLAVCLANDEINDHDTWNLLCHLVCLEVLSESQNKGRARQKLDRVADW